MHIETTSRDAAHADAGTPPKGQPAHSNPVTYINATEHSTLLDVVNAALAVNSSNDVVATLLGKSYTVTETMTLTRSLVLQGSQDAGRPTVLDCNGVPSMSVFITQAMNITLLNLTLSGCAETAVLLGMPTAQPGVAGTQAQPCVLLQGCSFLNNSGVAAGAIAATLGTHMSLTISDCTFLGNAVQQAFGIGDYIVDYDYGLGNVMQGVQGCSTISLPSGASNITNCLFLDNGLPQSPGQAAMLGNASASPTWLASSTVGMDCGGGGGEVRIQDTLFQGNVAEFGGAVYMHLYNIDSSGHYTPFSASATNLQDKVSGGLTYRCTLSLARVVMDSNYGKTSAGVYFSFTANRPNYGTVQSFAGSLMMTDSVFAGNVASLQNMVYSGFVAQDSFLIRLSNVSFLDNIGNSFMLQSCYATVSQCLFSGNRAEFKNTAQSFYGAPFVTLNSRGIRLFNSTFTNNSALLGGAVYIQDSAAFEMMIINCTFDGNSATAGGAIHIAGGTVHVWLLQNIVFTNNTASSTLNLPLLPPSESCGPGGGGAICALGVGGTVLVLQNVTMVGNSADMGGGLYIGSSPLCQAGPGCYSVTVDAATTFSNNTANTAGGAIFWLYENVLNITCAGEHSTLSLMDGRRSGDSSSNSSSGGSGDWIDVIDSTPWVLPCDNWLGNTVVAGYGPTLASSAFYMQPVFVTQGPRPPRRQAGPPRSGVQPSNGDPRATDLPPAPYAAPQGAAAVPLAGNTSSLTQQLAGSSGDPIAMNVFIRDFYLQLSPLSSHIIDDSQVRRSMAETALLVVCENTDTLGQTTATSESGVAMFTNLRLQDKVGASHPVNFKATSHWRDLQQMGSSVVKLRSCFLNELTSMPGDSCIPCGPGYFSISGNDTNCNECPANMECSSALAGAGVLVPAPGYFHSSPFSTHPMACSTPESCSFDGRGVSLGVMQAPLLNNAFNSSIQDFITAYKLAQCAEGYAGERCGHCASGYGLSLVGSKCKACPRRVITVLFLLLSNLANFLPILFTVNAALRYKGKSLDSPPSNPCSPGSRSHDKGPSFGPPRQRGPAGRLPDPVPTDRHGGRQSRRHAQTSCSPGDVPPGCPYPEEPCADTQRMGTKSEGDGSGADRDPQEWGRRQENSERLHGRRDTGLGVTLLGQEARLGRGEDTHACSADAGISFSAPYMGRSPFAISTCLDDESEGESDVAHLSPRPPLLRSPGITLEGRQMQAMEAVDTHHVPDPFTPRAATVDAAERSVTQATASAAKRHPVGDAAGVRDACPSRGLGGHVTRVGSGPAAAPPASDVSSLTPCNSPAHSHGGACSPTLCGVSSAAFGDTLTHTPMAHPPGSTSSPQQRMIPLPSHAGGPGKGSRQRERAVTFDGMVGTSGHSASAPLSAFAPSPPPRSSLLAQSPVTHGRASSPVVVLRTYGSTPLPTTSQELHRKHKPLGPHGPTLKPSLRPPSRRVSASLYRNGVTSGFSSSAAACVSSCSTPTTDPTHPRPLVPGRPPERELARGVACGSASDLPAALSPAASLRTRDDAGPVPRLAPGDSRKGPALLNMRSVGEFGLEVGDDELLQRAVAQDPWWDGVLQSPAVMELPMRSSGSCGTWTEEEQDTDRWTADAAAIIKIFVSWLQVGLERLRRGDDDVICLVGQAPVAWPPALRFYFTIVAQLSSASSMVSEECVLDHSLAPTSVQQVIVHVLLPLLFALVLALFFLLRIPYLLVRKGSLGQEPLWPYLARRTAVSLASILFVMYTQVTRALLGVFACVQLDSGSAVYVCVDGNPQGSNCFPDRTLVGRAWENDSNMACYTGPHLLLMLVVGVPFTVLFVFGMPLLSASWLWAHKAQLADHSFMAMYGPIYREYHPNCFYWESCVWLRKLLVIAVLVFLSSAQWELQLLIILAVLMGALAAQSYIRPFRGAAMNSLELVSLGSTLATYYISVFLINSGVSQPALTAASTGVITLNGSVVLWFCYVLYRETRVLAAHKLKRIKSAGILLVENMHSNLLMPMQSLTRPLVRTVSLTLKPASRAFSALVHPLGKFIPGGRASPLPAARDARSPSASPQPPTPQPPRAPVYTRRCRRGQRTQRLVRVQALNPTVGVPLSPGMAPLDEACNGMGSHYQVLGVTAGASDVEIKAAFRALAKVLHPDINQAPGAVASFMEVNAAYEALGDSSKRSQYDSFLRRTQEAFVSFDMESSSSDSSAAMWRAIEEAERARQQAKRARRDAEEAREKAHKGATALRQRATQERKSAAAATAAGSSTPPPPRTPGSVPFTPRPKSKATSTATAAGPASTTLSEAADTGDSSSDVPTSATVPGSDAFSSADTNDGSNSGSSSRESSSDGDPAAAAPPPLHDSPASAPASSSSGSSSEGATAGAGGNSRSPFASRVGGDRTGNSMVRVAGPVKPGGQVSMAARGGRAAVKRGQAELRETMRDARKDARAARRHASETRSLAQMAEMEAEALKQAAMDALRKERLQTQQTQTQAAAAQRRQRRRGAL
ncbi:MAG: hypothetical protein WDW38_003780 [Sanguina aurantia]